MWLLSTTQTAAATCKQQGLRPWRSAYRIHLTVIQLLAVWCWIIEDLFSADHWGLSWVERKGHSIGCDFHTASSLSLPKSLIDWKVFVKSLLLTYCWICVFVLIHHWRPPLFSLTCVLLIWKSIKGQFRNRQGSEEQNKAHSPKYHKWL